MRGGGGCLARQPAHGLASEPSSRVSFLPRDVVVITLAVIDDHPLTRGGIVRLFETDEDVRVVCSAASVQEFEAAGVRPADVIALDLYLGDDTPDLEAVGKLARHHQVLVVSASGRGGDVLAAIEAGASGYITKQASDESFVAAVHAVASGGFYLSSQLADVMHAEAKRRTDQPGGPKLSPREEEALRLVAEGFTHAQSARRMGVSQSTFDTYIKRVREKLCLGNKAELTRKAMELEAQAGPRTPAPTRPVRTDAG